MKTGAILNTGTRTLQGRVRKLTVKDQLQQIVNLRGVTAINHPVHGKIEVSNSRANELLKFENGHLVRFKKEEFNG